MFYRKFIGFSSRIIFNPTDNILYVQDFDLEGLGIKSNHID